MLIVLYLIKKCLLHMYSFTLVKVLFAFFCEAENAYHTWIYLSEWCHTCIYLSDWCAITFIYALSSSA